MTPHLTHKLPVLLSALSLALAGCASMGNKADAAKDSPFTVAVIGDVPYGTAPTDTRQLRVHPRFIDALNADPDVALVVHVGDTHAGKQYCT